MAIVSWLRIHKKSVLAHTLILGGFLLFLLFLAEPLFDRLENMEGESKLYEISVPVQTNNIIYDIRGLAIFAGGIDIEGWAFITNLSSDNSRVFIVLKSNATSYVFDTQPLLFPGVTKIFKELRLNLDDSGFTGHIPIKKVKNGEYVLGIYIESGDTKALQYIDSIVKKTGNDLKLTKYVSKPHDIALPAQSTNIKAAVDFATEQNEENNSLIEIKGWAFIEGQSMENCQTYVVLKSSTNIYVFDTVLWQRPDINRAFSPTNVDLYYAGFIARIPTQSIENDQYEIGIYIRKNDIEILQYGFTYGFNKHPQITIINGVCDCK